ncbi:hypothetical protein Bca52824_025409 [Brassica carinata]|uniref:Ataxin 2 SM domain-containing protein n=1 Tax=Brassica carinata TaxID=52824 RepID=A0A8X7V9W5_BRACI|nr:hypothetical protein Bca52824_025409 [Brassica carinata]
MAMFKQFESGMDTLPDPQSKSSSNGSPHRREKSRDSLVYLTTCMIGHPVEVHLKNGSVYSGIFHAADVEKNFGIVLKMASLIKDSTLRVHRSRSEFFRKAPFRTFTIPADELVQVVAEDLSVSSDGTLNAVQSEKPVELLTDSSISTSRHVDLGREVTHWEPDGNVPPVLDNMFDGTSKSGFNEEDDILLDTCNDQTSGGSSTSSVQKSASSSGKGHEDVPSDSQPSRNNRNVDHSCSISGDDARHLPSEQRSKDFPAPGSSISESQLGEPRKNNNPEVSHSSRSAEESVSGLGVIKEGPKVGGGGTSASKIVAERQRQGSRVSGKTKSEISFGQSDSRSPESLPSPSTPSRPGLPLSSSIGSLSSSEKSTLNPDAKFKQFESGMDTLPDHQSKSSSNVSPHRREKSRDSFVYLTTCMIGHLVEVHLKNGSVYSGIFHAADVEKNFGIVLKMASLIKDSTLRVHKSRSEFYRKPPFKTFIIPADELVQVVAEDLSVSSDGTLNTVQSQKPVELLTDSSIVQKPTSSSGKGYGDVVGDSQPSRNYTNVDQSCSVSGEDARHLPSEQRSKVFSAPGSSISESQLGEPRKNDNPEVSHSSRSAEESVSGHGDIKEGAKIGGGGTSASKTVSERERQGSQVSGKTKSESSFEQSDCRSSESRPAPSTPSLPGLLPSSSIGSLSSSEKFTFNRGAKEFKPSQPPAVGQAQSPMEYTSFYCPVAPPIQQMPVQAQFPMADGSFYYPAPPVQQMPGGYGIQPQYFEHYPMFYYQYYGQQYGQTGYPQYAQAQYPQQQQQQMMMGHPPMPQMMIGQPSRPPPPNQPENPNNEGRE